jgi:hypothetical protein
VIHIVQVIIAGWNNSFRAIGNPALRSKSKFQEDQVFTSLNLQPMPVEPELPEMQGGLLQQKEKTEDEEIRE